MLSVAWHESVKLPTRGLVRNQAGYHSQCQGEKGLLPNMYIEEKNLEAILGRMRSRPSEGNVLSSAVQTLTERFDSLSAEMGKINYTELSNEYDRSVADNKIEDISRKELDRLCELEDTLNSYVMMAQRRDEALYTLIGLDFFLRKISMNSLKEQLKDDTHNNRHQVVTRYGWICCQNEAMHRGKSFNLPFQCDVGPSNRRKGLDREFYTLLEFLPLMNAGIGTNYLFEKHQGNDCPDFVIAGTAGLAGLEITEVTLSPQANRERKEEESFVAFLDSRFGQTPADITIWRRPTWAVLNKNTEEIAAWLRGTFDEFSANQHGDDSFYAEFEKLRFRIALRHSESGHLWDMSQTGYEYGCVLENALALESSAIINKKLASSSAPNTIPTFLVVYVNASLVTQPRQLLEGVKQGVGEEYKRKFDDIWFLVGKKAISLLNGLE